MGHQRTMETNKVEMVQLYAGAGQYSYRAIYAIAGAG